MNALRRNSFAQEIDSAAFLGNQEEIGNRICHDAVDLFRHGAVEAAQPGLNVNYLDPEFRRY